MNALFGITQRNFAERFYRDIGVVEHAAQATEIASIWMTCVEFDHLLSCDPPHQLDHTELIAGRQ